MVNVTIIILTTPNFKIDFPFHPDMVKSHLTTFFLLHLILFINILLHCLFDEISNLQFITKVNVSL